MGKPAGLMRPQRLLLLNPRVFSRHSVRHDQVIIGDTLVGVPVGVDVPARNNGENPNPDLVGLLQQNLGFARLFQHSQDRRIVTYNVRY